MQQIANHNLSYDAEQHLTEVKENGMTIAEFGYDGDGQMVSANIGEVTTSYVGGYFE